MFYVKPIIALSVLLITGTANAADGWGLPDIMHVLSSVEQAILYITLAVRYIFAFGAFAWFIYAFMNLYATTNGNAGHRLFASNARPTVVGSVLQMIIAAIMLAMLYDFSPALVVQSMFNDNTNTITLYSVGSYVPTTDHNQMFKVIMRIVYSVFYLLGFLAYFRASSTWYKKVEGTSNESASKIIIWYILGTLCFFLDFLNGVMASIIGFDMFGWLLNSVGSK